MKTTMEKIVLYGAGKRGQGMYEFLKSISCEKYIYGFCDRNVTTKRNMHDRNIWTVDELKKQSGVIFCLTLLDVREKEKIRKELGEERCIEFIELADVIGMDRLKFNRDFCAFYHIDEMRDYYEKAEDTLDIFWGENSAFRLLFDQLELRNVIELGCGHGRHVCQYVDRAEKILLVDVLQENLDYCQHRYSEIKKINYYKCTGYDLKDLKESEYSAVYSYDAMVHFELLDIYSYLKDMYRVLQKGGQALLHHSNYAKDYKADFCNAPESRNFMSKDIFAYLAYRAGFKVKEQKVIDWNGVKGLDCITLLEK